MIGERDDADADEKRIAISNKDKRHHAMLLPKWWYFTAVNSFTLLFLFTCPIFQLLDTTRIPFQDVNFPSIGNAGGWNEEIIYNDSLFIDGWHCKNMWAYRSAIVVFLHYLSWIVPVGAASVHYFPNIYVAFDNSSPVVFNGTLEQCLCRMTKDSQLISLNYFSTGQTCQLHWRSDLYNSYQIYKDTDTRFYAEALPQSNVSSKSGGSLVFDESCTFSFSVRKKFQLSSISVPLVVIWLHSRWSIRKLHGKAAWKPLLFALDYQGIRVFSIVLISIIRRREI